MVQYEKVNGVPKLVNTDNANEVPELPEVTDVSYLDGQGNKKDIPVPKEYMKLIKRLSGKNKKPEDMAALNNLLGLSPNMPMPNKKALSVMVSLAYPHLTYHQRYMHELNVLAIEGITQRNQRKSSLLSGIKQYKEHVDHQASETSE